MINTDQIRRFPITSGQGNVCKMVIYDNDISLINVTAIKSALEDYLIQGYNKLYNALKKTSLTLVIQRLDNKSSRELIKAIVNWQLRYQLVPPGSHQTLLAKQAIQTFKDHFILIIYKVNDKYPANQ